MLFLGDTIFGTIINKLVMKTKNIITYYIPNLLGFAPVNTNVLLPIIHV